MVHLRLQMETVRICFNMMRDWKLLWTECLNVVSRKRSTSRYFCILIDLHLRCRLLELLSSHGDPILSLKFSRRARIQVCWAMCWTLLWHMFVTLNGETKFSRSSSICKDNRKNQTTLPSARAWYISMMHNQRQKIYSNWLKKEETYTSYFALADKRII